MKSRESYSAGGHPLVSVVIPVRDRPHLLVRAIRSVLSQSYPHLELVVVDDGSTEDLSEAAQLVSEGPHQFRRIPPQGVSAARNVGIQHSSGEWIAFLDSDDLWKPEKLSAQMQLHAEHRALRISQCQEEWFRNGTYLPQKAIHEMPDGEAFYRSLQLCCISPSSVVLHRTIFEDYGVFDENLPVCEDYDLWIRITPRESVGLVREVLVTKHGGHEDQLSRSEPAMDRFRVYALAKLLAAHDADEILTVEQVQAAQDVLRRRIQILQKGAMKRDSHALPLYIELEEQFSRGNFAECRRCSVQLLGKLGEG
ncbi:glycosyltransferase family 2 protein [bacterium]|nr:glycosyltransferase family 2 protein [bacterium]